MDTSDCSLMSTFNWHGLPTELKEHIITFCLHQSPPPMLPKGKVKGAPEVTAQLGKWASLLAVSHQVRALCLRLCLVGSSTLLYKSGLCIDIQGHRSLKDCFRRLGKYFLMFEAGDFPTTNDDEATMQLAKLYNDFPLIYPQLNRYATLRHGIRKLHLEFSFLDSMHFFRVEVGSFAQWYRDFRIDHRVFLQLPALNQVLFRLPDPTGYLEDRVLQCGPRLFYGDPFNCPRILHRVIYERAAEVMAECDWFEFGVYGFMDLEEEKRFRSLQKEARKRVRVGMEVMREMYNDGEGGGVELGEWAQPGVVGDEMEEEKEEEVVHDAFWPPKCRCRVRCRKVLHPETNP